MLTSDPVIVRYWDSARKIFIKQEKNTRIKNEFHGQNGKLIVSDPSCPHPLTSALINASVSAGIKRSYDFNGSSQDGVGWYQVNAYKSL